MSEVRAEATPTARSERLWGSWRLRHLPVVLAVCGVTLVAAAVLGGVTNGTSGAMGAATGVAVVAASYLVSTFVVAWADSVEPRLVFPLGMTTYVVKSSVFLAALLLTAGSRWPGMVPMGWGMAAGVLAWTAAQIWWTVRNAAPESL